MEERTETSGLYITFRPRSYIRIQLRYLSIYLLSAHHLHNRKDKPYLYILVVFDLDRIALYMTDMV